MNFEMYIYYDLLFTIFVRLWLKMSHTMYRRNQSRLLCLNGKVFVSFHIFLVSSAGLEAQVSFSINPDFKFRVPTTNKVNLCH